MTKQKLEEHLDMDPEERNRRALDPSGRIEKREQMRKYRNAYKSAGIQQVNIFVPERDKPAIVAAAKKAAGNELMRRLQQERATGSIELADVLCEYAPKRRFDYMHLAELQKLDDPELQEDIDEFKTKLTEYKNTLRSKHDQLNAEHSNVDDLMFHAAMEYAFVQWLTGAYEILKLKSEGAYNI